MDNESVDRDDLVPFVMDDDKLIDYTDPALDPLNETTTVRDYDVHLRLRMEEDQNHLREYGTPDEWKWDQILDAHLGDGGVGQVEVMSYVRHSSTYEVDEEGEIVQTTISEVVSPLDSGMTLKDCFETTIELARQMISDDGKFDEDSEAEQLAIDAVENYVEDVFGGTI